MLLNIVFGVSIMTLCLFLQSLLIIVAVRYYSRHKHLVNSPSFGSSVIVINAVMLLLVVGNLAQVAIWGLLFEALGEFEQFSAAFYHSAVNFATLGYGDVVMSDDNKLLGPIQAINGVLMIGVSTAALMAVFQDAMRQTVRARHRRDDTSSS
jgi:hypothetical protein